jgi:hypothetical protein
MHGIKLSRVLLGGLLAGVVINVIEGVLNAVILADQWSAAMTRLGLSGEPNAIQIAGFNLAGFVTGILAVWLYAAIRPRYGIGPKTAALAGFAVWLLAYVLPMSAPALLNILPRRMIAIGLSVGLPEAILATIVGSWLYREASESPQTRAAGAGN